MDEKEKKLREDLEFHLDTLRRNLEVVSMEDLKAKYAKPFKDLKDNICKTATAYTQYISLGGIRVKSRYGDEAVKYINEAIKDTPYLKKISEAAFERQDMDEIAALARQLREVVLQSLHVFSLPLFCLYVPTECMNDYHTPPVIYNDVTSQVLRNGEWQLAEHIEAAVITGSPVRGIRFIPITSTNGVCGGGNRLGQIHNFGLSVRVQHLDAHIAHAAGGSIEFADLLSGFKSRKHR